MANQVPIFQAAPKTSCLLMNNASGTTVLPIYTAGATDGGLVDHVSVTSTDTAPVTLVLTVTSGGTDCIVGELVIPIGAGTDGSTPSVNLLDAVAMPFLQSGGGLPLGASAILSVNAKSAITAATVVNLVAFGGDY